MSYRKYEVVHKSLEVYGSKKIFQDGTPNFYILKTDLRIAIFRKNTYLVLPNVITLGKAIPNKNDRIIALYEKTLGRCSRL